MGTRTGVFHFGSSYMKMLEIVLVFQTFVIAVIFKVYAGLRV